jgi:DNA-binding NtrC family response regulator
VSGSSTLLVVEDDDEVRLSLRDFLSGHGYQVFVASDGVGAIKQLTEQDFSLLITDFRLKQFGGGEFIRFLQKFCDDLPVVVISGYLDADPQLPYPFIAKPFDYDDLLKLVERILSGEHA